MTWIILIALTVKEIINCVNGKKCRRNGVKGFKRVTFKISLTISLKFKKSWTILKNTRRHLKLFKDVKSLLQVKCNLKPFLALIFFKHLICSFNVLKTKSFCRWLTDFSLNFLKNPFLERKLAQPYNLTYSNNSKWEIKN